MPLRVFTDKLQHIAGEMQGMEDQIDPVDVFGGFVAVDKYAKDNLDRTQENIQWKVGLKASQPFESEVRNK